MTRKKRDNTVPGSEEPEQEETLMVETATRIQPISDDELAALVKSRNATGKRLQRMEDYNNLIREIVDTGGRGRVTLDGENNQRELSLRLSHAARRLGIKIETISLANGQDVVVRVLAEPTS